MRSEAAIQSGDRSVRNRSSLLLLSLGSRFKWKFYFWDLHIELSRFVSFSIT